MYLMWTLGGLALAIGVVTLGLGLTDKAFQGFTEVGFKSLILSLFCLVIAGIRDATERAAFYAKRTMDLLEKRTSAETQEPMRKQ